MYTHRPVAISTRNEENETTASVFENRARECLHSAIYFRLNVISRRFYCYICRCTARIAVVLLCSRSDATIRPQISESWKERGGTMFQPLLCVVLVREILSANRGPFATLDVTYLDASQRDKYDAIEIGCHVSVSVRARMDVPQRK